MPKPNANESRADFLDRCIPQVVGEGNEPDQAVAMCISYYDEYSDKAMNLSDADTIGYWKAFDRRRESMVDTYTRVMQKAIREQLKIYEGATDFQDLKKTINPKPIEEAYVKTYTEVGDVFARRIYSDLKGLDGLETKQEPQWVARMRKYALIDASGRIVGVNEETQRIVNALIVKGIEEGLDIEQIKRLIIGSGSVQPLNGTLQQRARRIARTEIISASNAGSLEGARSTGLNFKKQWLSTFDGKAREGHESADGQIVGKDDPFRVMGENLDYPGDPNGSAKNTINCRCTQIYITEE